MGLTRPVLFPSPLHPAATTYNFAKGADNFPKWTLSALLSSLDGQDVSPLLRANTPSLVPCSNFPEPMTPGPESPYQRTQVVSTK